MVAISKYVLTVADVARALELSPDWVRRLGDELEPVRLPNGHRRYSVDAVQRYATKRAKRT